MNFVSAGFLLFFAVVLFLFIVLPSRFRKGMLLVASYLFYATWSVPFIAVILLTSNIDYWMSQVIQRSQSFRVRKGALVFALALNLLVLGFFKYCNFFLDSGHSLAHWLGMELPLPTALNILLPLGISFYTFEAISYMVDVYRGNAPAKKWLDYNFYIMYFPHLISGPIVRFGELVRQYEAPLELPSVQRIAKGVELVLLGYCFKVFIADVAAGIVDPVFDNPQSASVFMTYLAVLGFTVQIYYDFMGYTHIARGVSLMLNIELPLNFNFPYLATNISNFWERWHISLSRWIRDYLYIPLGGSRKGSLCTVWNLILTMLIAGAWHGAGWTFIAWGGFHGALLACYHLYKGLRDRLLGSRLSDVLSSPVYRLTTIGLTFVCVVLGWVLFRAPDFTSALVVLGHLTQVGAFVQGLVSELGSSYLGNVFCLAFFLLCCFVGPWVTRLLERAYLPLPFWVKVQTACLVLVLAYLSTADGTTPFIYFQF
jgi:alginate O-acetyltransferase complex protein AlgI